MLLQSQWEITDKEIPVLIKNLQLKKIQVLALTSFRRGEMGKIPSIEDWRNAHLKKHHIDFNITAGISQDYFEIQPLNHNFNKKRPVYKNGVIYTDLHLKDDVLDAFIKQTHLKPKEIIFIDDRLSNVAAIENFCKSAAIRFIGIHDKRILKRFKNCFDEKLGKYQFRYLEHHHIWLQDMEAAKEMVNIPITQLEAHYIQCIDEK